MVNIKNTRGNKEGLWIFEYEDNDCSRKFYLDGELLWTTYFNYSFGVMSYVCQESVVFDQVWRHVHVEEIL